jgi:hypothetical protein
MLMDLSILPPVQDVTLVQLVLIYMVDIVILLVHYKTNGKILPPKLVMIVMNLVLVVMVLPNMIVTVVQLVLIYITDNVKLLVLMELIQMPLPDIVNLVPEIVLFVTVLLLNVVNIRVILVFTIITTHVKTHVQLVLGLILLILPVKSVTTDVPLVMMPLILLVQLVMILGTI